MLYTLLFLALIFFGMRASHKGIVCYPLPRDPYDYR